MKEYPKYVRCIDDRASGGGVIKGKIYIAKSETTGDDGEKLYALVEDPRTWFAYRFEDSAGV